jgi:MFS family permease
MSTRTRIKPIVAIFITVLIDLLGFAMFIPDLQLRGESIARSTFGANSGTQIAWFVGIMLASYSIAQLITAPILGRISDSRGRRIVLLLSTLLSTVSYLFYGHLVTTQGIIISRALSGIAAANLGVAFAYVADTTEPEHRSKSLGLLGAAFGIGFIFGPVIGSVLLGIGHDKPLILGNVAACLCAINFLFIYFFVPESLPKDHVPSERHLLADLRVALTTPGVGLLLLMYFSVQLCVTNLETTYFRLLNDPNWIFHFADAKHSGALVLACFGIVGVVVQGWLIRIITKTHSDLQILRYAYLVFVPSFVLVPFTPLWFPGIIVIIGLALSTSFANPTLNAIISKSAPKNMQGGVFGITQALGATARAIGPLMSSPLFAIKPYAPYLAGGVIALFPTYAVWAMVSKAIENRAA